jgi:hypothetical protein
MLGDCPKRLLSPHDSQRCLTDLHKLEKELGRLQNEKASLQDKLSAKDQVRLGFQFSAACLTYIGEPQALAREENKCNSKDAAHKTAMQKAAQEKNEIQKQCSRLQNLDQGVGHEH